MKMDLVLYTRTLLRQASFKVLYWWEVVAGYMYVYRCPLYLFVFWYQSFSRQLAQWVTVIFCKITHFTFILSFADNPRQTFTQLQTLYENAINFSSVLWLKPVFGSDLGFLHQPYYAAILAATCEKVMVSIHLSLFLCDHQGRIHLIQILAL